MALVRITAPVNLSEQADFDKHGNLIEAAHYNSVNTPIPVIDGEIPQGVVLQIGGVIYHSTTGGTAITGTASGYVKVTPVTPDGETATAEYVQDLADVGWNAQYNGYYNPGGTSLYLFDEGKALKDAPQITALLSRYVTRTESGDTYIGRNLDVGGRVKVEGPSSTTVPMINVEATTNAGADATLIKGSIASNTTSRYFLEFEGSGGAKNLQVSTNGDITSAGVLSASTVNTGQGNNNLFAMNQNVRTTDNVTHNNITASNNLVAGGSLGVSAMGTRLRDTGSLFDGAEKVIPAGIWCWSINSNTEGGNATEFQIFSEGSFRTMGRVDSNFRRAEGMVISDGTNARIKNIAGGVGYTLIKVSV